MMMVVVVGGVTSGSLIVGKNSQINLQPIRGNLFGISLLSWPINITAVAFHHF